MSKWWQFLTVSESFQLLVFKIGTGMIRLSGYNKVCNLLRVDFEELTSLGYNLTRRSKAISINGVDSKDKFKYLIRPGTADKKVFYQVILNNEYQPMIDIISSRGLENSINKIVDAGSNIGLTSIFFKKYYPDAEIISIEPDEENFNQQKKNIKVNDFENSIKLLKYALWTNNTDLLSISNNFRDGESWSKSVTLKNSGNTKVKALALNDIINLYNNREIIDILKIDVEGAEEELFRNEDFVKALANSVKFLCLEIHDELNIRQNIYETFSEINFSCQTVGETCFCINNSLVK